jgi:secondary thiamine-phosphate synthase enzyme
MIDHIEFALTPKPRGYHIITDEVLNHLTMPQKGLVHLFIKHTSAALTINENADPDVRIDFETILNKMVPENQKELVHTIEGPDDMPAHIKAALIGTSVSIPIDDFKLQLGSWQGIYLCEFRNHGGSRKLIATIIS